MRTCLRVFEELLDRWGLLISTTSSALAHAALGDWCQTAFALGVADSLSARIGGHLFPAVQAAIDAIAEKTAAELGPSTALCREAGRAVGRGDCIATAMGLAPELTPPCPQPQKFSLTRRGQEVTELIAGGLTNRQIAKRLFIAQRTVDTHVGHILAKLGCSNRSQAAVLIGGPPASGRTYIDVGGGINTRARYVGSPIPDPGRDVNVSLRWSRLLPGPRRSCAWRHFLFSGSCRA